MYLVLYFEVLLTPQGSHVWGIGFGVLDKSKKPEENPRNTNFRRALTSATVFLVVLLESVACGLPPWLESLLSKSCPLSAGSSCFTSSLSFCLLPLLPRSGPSCRCSFFLTNLLSRLASVCSFFSIAALAAAARRLSSSAERRKTEKLLPMMSLLVTFCRHS